MADVRVCILGGSGFVGQHLVGRLSKTGTACRIVTRHPERFSHLKIHPGCELATTDIFDRAALAGQFVGCAAVINLIGILNEDSYTGSFRKIHVELVDTLVDACRDAGVPRLLHMSALNASEANGSSQYLRTKGEGENRAHTHGSASMQVTSFRPSVIFGPGDSFFNRFAQLLRFTPGIFPLACPETRFAPVYVGDVVEAFRRALKNRHTFGKHFDLCGPRSFSLRELVLYTAQMLNLKRRVVGLGDRSSQLQARLLERLPGRPFSQDNYLSLQTDSTCDENGFPDLGIKPKDIDEIVPLYLGGKNYRGRFQRYRSTPAR